MKRKLVTLQAQTTSMCPKCGGVDNWCQHCNTPLVVNESVYCYGEGIHECQKCYNK